MLQLSDQRPAADEAVVQQGEDGRALQDRLPEGPPRTYRKRKEESGGEPTEGPELR